MPYVITMEMAADPDPMDVELPDGLRVAYTRLDHVPKSALGEMITEVPGGPMGRINTRLFMVITTHDRHPHEQCTPYYSCNSYIIASNIGESSNGWSSPILCHPHDRYAWWAAVLSGRTRRVARCSGRCRSSASCSALA